MQARWGEITQDRLDILCIFPGKSVLGMATLHSLWGGAAPRGSFMLWGRAEAAVVGRAQEGGSLPGLWGRENTQRERGSWVWEKVGASRARGEDSPARREKFFTTDVGTRAALWEGAPRGGGERLPAVWVVSKKTARRGDGHPGAGLGCAGRGRPRHGPVSQTEATPETVVVGPQCADVSTPEQGLACCKELSTG